MKIDDLELVKRIFEGAMMAADKPLSKRALKELFDEMELPDDDLVNEALVQLEAECESRGYELKRVASGYRFQVKQDLGPWIGKLWKERAPRYSRALLETLSLVAYRQPITRGEIEEIRGVAVSTQIIKTLLEREWVKVVGHRDVPGRPAIYATTKQFLDYFNLKSLDQLPPLAEIRELGTISRELNIDLPPDAIEPANDDGLEEHPEGEVVADGSAVEKISTELTGQAEGEDEPPADTGEEPLAEETDADDEFAALENWQDETGQSERAPAGTEAADADESMAHDGESYEGELEAQMSPAADGHSFKL